MNQIIKHTGEYISTYFKGKTGIFDIVGTVAGPGKAMTCMDTFKNRATGELIESKREKIWKWAEAGDITLEIKTEKLNQHLRRSA
jgi:hypothetical protein